MENMFSARGDHPRHNYNATNIPQSDRIGVALMINYKITQM